MGGGGAGGQNSRDTHAANILSSGIQRFLFKTVQVFSVTVSAMSALLPTKPGPIQRKVHHRAGQCLKAELAAGPRAPHKLQSSGELIEEHKPGELERLLTSKKSCLNLHSHSEPIVRTRDTQICILYHIIQGARNITVGICKNMEVFTNIKEKELTSLAAEQKKHNRLFFILFNPIINLGHMMGHCSISVDRG